MATANSNQISVTPSAGKTPPAGYQFQYTLGGQVYQLDYTNDIVYTLTNGILQKSSMSTRKFRIAWKSAQRASQILTYAAANPTGNITDYNNVADSTMTAFIQNSVQISV